MNCTSMAGGTRAALAVFAAGAAHADLSGYTIEKLVFEGGADPVAGTLNQMISEIDLDEDGRVVTVSYVDDDALFPIKIFGVENGALGALVTEGDPVPDTTGGLTFSDVNRPRIAAPDILAYLATPPPPAVTAVPPLGLWLLALALTAVAAVNGRHGRRGRA